MIDYGSFHWENEKESDDGEYGRKVKEKKERKGERMGKEDW